MAKEEALLNVTEAALLWDLLVDRYKCLEESQIYHNYAHDLDFKQVIKTGMNNLLERQANELEKQLIKYKMPMPTRPPKAMQTQDNSMVFNDKFLLRQIFEGCQSHIDYLARSFRSFITNDSLRHQVGDFLKDELTTFDLLCRYAKVKGWLEIPPPYETH